jgi:hypothetical protein
LGTTRQQKNYYNSKIHGDSFLAFNLRRSERINPFKLNNFKFTFNLVKFECASMARTHFNGNMEARNINAYELKLKKGKLKGSMLG